MTYFKENDYPHKFEKYTNTETLQSGKSGHFNAPIN